MDDDKELRSGDSRESKHGATDELATFRPALEDSQSLWQEAILIQAWHYVRIRRQRPITADDVRALPAGSDSQSVSQSIVSFLKHHPSARCGVIRALVSIYRHRVWVALGYLIAQLALVFTPLLARIVTRYLTRYQSGQRPSLASPLIAALFLPIVLCFTNVVSQQEYARFQQVGAGARAGVILAVVAHTSRLTDGARLSWTDGRLLSLITGDSMRIVSLCLYQSDLYACLAAIIGASTLLIVTLGLPALAGLSVIAASVVLQVYLGRRIHNARAKATALADERMGLTHELLTSLTALKLQGWEAAATRRINEVRRREIGALRVRKILAASDSIFGTMSPVIALSVAFAAAKNDSIDGATVLFRLLTNPLVNFSRGVERLGDGVHATNRVGDFLRLPIRQSHIGITNDEKLAVDTAGQFRWPVADTKTPLTTPFALELDLKIPRGELVAVIGPVAHGKTALCRTLLDGLDCASGHLRLPPKVIGSDQQTYIVSGATLRDQIVFTQPFDETLYTSILRATALDQDAHSFPDGDQTAARICLARALYAAQSQHADILVLDDPLSALDSRVGQHVFDHAIAPLAGKTTCIVATHALHFAHRFDRILFLGEPGRVTEQGSFDELVTAGGSFSQLIQTHASPAGDVESAELAGAQAADHAPRPAVDIMLSDQASAQATSLSSYIAFAKLSRASVSLALIGLATAATVAATVIGGLVLLWWTNKTFDLSSGAFIGLYAGMALALTLAYVTMVVAMTIFTLAGSRRLHEFALDRLARATTAWLTTTPLGRIMAYLGADLGQIDSELDESLRFTVFSIAQVVAAIVTIGIVDSWSLLALVLALPPSYWLVRRFQPAYRSVRAIDLLLRARMVAGVNETLKGLTTHKAFGTLKIALRRLALDIDRASAVDTLPHVLRAWLGIWLNTSTAVLVGVVAVSSIIRRDSIDPNKVGLALSSLLYLVYTVGNIPREYSRLDADLNCAERILGLATIAQEPQDGEAAPSEWPASGELVFRDVDLRYRPELPLVLHGVSFTVRAGEKVAIVGRTGAGKSSLLHALFRMTELAGGQITVDGIDVAKLKLLDLRQRLCVLPQTTMILKGWIRDNLDPFQEHDDATLYDALRRSRFLEEGQTLDFEIDSDGRNISQGQRALLSLARALVQRSKILVLDEASAHVDAITDAQLQSTLATEFKDCTVIAIAHRLRTIIGYDKVIVMQDGQVAEIGSPQELYARDGVFKVRLCAVDSLTRAVHVRFVLHRSGRNRCGSCVSHLDAHAF